MLRTEKRYNDSGANFSVKRRLDPNRTPRLYQLWDLGSRVTFELMTEFA